MAEKNSKTTPNQFTVWHEALLKFLRRMITDANAILLKISKGRMGNSFLGVPVLLLTTIGRKSGKPRTRPLYYLEDGGNLVLVASNAGTSTDPAWLLNIKANPNVTVELDGKVLQMRARIATPEEKNELWPKLMALFPTWQMMEDRSVRTFKVVILEPRQ